MTASNRSIQWREKVIEPLFESLPDHTIMLAFAKKLGFGAEFVKNISVTKGKLGFDEPNVEDMTREINAGNWTIGYTGQTPERLKAHMRVTRTSIQSDAVRVEHLDRQRVGADRERRRLSRRRREDGGRGVVGGEVLLRLLAELHIVHETVAALSAITETWTTGATKPAGRVKVVRYVVVVFGPVVTPELVSGPIHLLVPTGFAQ